MTLDDLEWIERDAGNVFGKYRYAWVSDTVSVVHYTDADKYSITRYVAGTHDVAEIWRDTSALTAQCVLNELTQEGNDDGQLPDAPTAGVSERVR